MSETNKAIAQRFFDVFNTGDVDALDELAHPDAVDHDPYSPFADEGIEGEKKTIAMYRAAFSDLKMTVDDMIAEGDKVVIRWHVEGTHDGEVAGMAPTGAHSTSTGITIQRFADGKVAESWNSWDVLNYMRSIGAIPDPEAATA